MKTLAIIGGSGFDQLPDFRLIESRTVETPYGEPSSPVLIGEFVGRDILFLPRHGQGHRYPPHQINYRANIHALKTIGATDVIAFAAVGGISPHCNKAKLVLPDQIIDYTYGRDHTFFDRDANKVEHIDFTEPYTPALRQAIVSSAARSEIPLVNGGVYGATQGPRLETPAEINRMERDGCDIVGMTGMPEAALAREAEIRYACLALIVNAAAGRSTVAITMELILSNLSQASDLAITLIRNLEL